MQKIFRFSGTLKSISNFLQAHFCTDHCHTSYKHVAGNNGTGHNKIIHA